RYKEACEDLTGLIRSLIKEGEEDLTGLIRLLTKKKEDLTDLIRSRIKKEDLAVETYDESISDLHDLLKVKPDDAWAKKTLGILEES
ncbi:15430_t:CDS:2, partial [Gigaspora rosea]